MSIGKLRKEAEELNAEIVELLQRKDRLNDSIKEIQRLSASLEATVLGLGVIPREHINTNDVLDG